MNISIKLGHGATMPTKAHPDDAGWDIYYSTDYRATELITSIGTNILPTGLYLDIPVGWYGKLETRSSLARQGVFVIGGVIDAGYHGEVKVILWTEDTFVIQPGTKIAQLLILPVPDVQWQPVDALPDSERGAAGFGSSDRRG